MHLQSVDGTTGTGGCNVALSTCLSPEIGLLEWMGAGQIFLFPMVSHLAGSLSIHRPLYLQEGYPKLSYVASLGGKKMKADVLKPSSEFAQCHFPSFYWFKQKASPVSVGGELNVNSVIH